MTRPAGVRILVGYDGSPAATAAIETAGLMLPAAEATVVHLWSPPDDLAALRRLAVDAGTVAELTRQLQVEGTYRGTRIAATGVTVARAAGWATEPLVRRTLAGPGMELAALAEELRPDLVLVGARGLSGARTLLGSVSDVVVHRSPCPILVVPPLDSGAFADLAAGPVLVGWDGSTGAAAALSAAHRSFPNRDVLAVTATGTAEDPPEQPALEGPDGVAGPALVPVHRGILGPGPAYDVADALARYAEDRHAATIVVGRRGRSALREIVLGSVTMATLHHARRPVLVVPDPD